MLIILEGYSKALNEKLRQLESLPQKVQNLWTIEALQNQVDYLLPRVDTKLQAIDDKLEHVDRSRQWTQRGCSNMVEAIKLHPNADGITLDNEIDRFMIESAKNYYLRQTRPTPDKPSSSGQHTQLSNEISQLPEGQDADEDDDDADEDLGGIGGEDDWVEVPASRKARHKKKKQQQNQIQQNQHNAEAKRPKRDGNRRRRRADGGGDGDSRAGGGGSRGGGVGGARRKR